MNGSRRQERAGPAAGGLHEADPPAAACSGARWMSRSWAAGPVVQRVKRECGGADHAAAVEMGGLEYPSIRVSKASGRSWARASGRG